MMQTQLLLLVVPSEKTGAETTYVLSWGKQGFIQKCLSQDEGRESEQEESWGESCRVIRAEEMVYTTLPADMPEVPPTLQSLHARFGPRILGKQPDLVIDNFLQIKGGNYGLKLPGVGF